MSRLVQSDCFRVEFVTRGDRIGHAVFVAESARGEVPVRWVELFRSIEGATDAAWPESPPLQELHVESRDGGSVALLVGRAGKSHWSASVGFERGGDDVGQSESQRLVVDIACRVASAAAASLGSTYEPGDGVVCIESPAEQPTGRSTILLRTPSGRCWRLAVDAAGTIERAADSGRFRVVPPPGSDAAPATIRWRITLAENFR